MTRRLYADTAGLVAIALAGVWLSFWLAGRSDVSALRMKTNTCVGLILLGGALLAHGRRPRVAQTLAAVAAAIGSATLFEYASGVSFGIDEILARDAYTEESARFPNRMSPNAAVGLALLGLTLMLLPSHRRALALAGQFAGTTVFAVAFLALIGYLYGVERLYQPTSYIRMSFSTSIALLLLSSGLLSTRRDVGYMRVLVSNGPGGVLVRRLLPVGVLLPVLLGRLELSLGGRDALEDTALEAFTTLALIAVFVLIVHRLARILDELHEKRIAAVAVTSRLEAVTETLSLAATVDEVAKASVESGIPAFGGDAAVFFVLESNALRSVYAREYSADASRAYAPIPLDSPLPAARAIRERTPLFLESSKDFEAIAFEPASGYEGWVALPLEGRGGRILGLLTIAFASKRAFDPATRVRLQRMALHCGQALDRALLFDSEIAARARAESASRAKDEFLAMLGHELRNPLSPILTSLELMKIKDPAPRKEREIIERQVQHMTRLVDDLLDVSRITRAKVSLERKNIELRSVVAGAIEVSSPLLEQKRHQVVVDMPETGLLVNADPQRLGQVVANLVNNAAKFTPPGGRIVVSASREGTDAVLRVRDDGAGVDPRLLPRVFDLFVQGDQTIDRSAGGLGLGLAIVRTLTEMHGGRVSAHSEGPGKGSEFTVSIPLVTGDAIAATEERGEAAATPPRVIPARGRSILVVDDNVDAATTLALALECDGHRVEVVHDGVAAIEAVQHTRPEIVFLDVGLPLMDGFEVARRLRAMDGSIPLTLVAITGYGQPEDRERALQAGFDRHLVKPVPVEEVLALAAAPPPTLEIRRA